MSYLFGGIKVFVNAFILIFSFIYRAVLGIVYSFIHLFTFMFGSLRKLFVVAIPLVYLFNVFVYGTKPFTFSNAIEHIKETYIQLVNDNKIILIAVITVVGTAVFWGIASTCYSVFCNIDARVGYANYLALCFNEKRIKAIKLGTKQAKYGTGDSAVYAMMNDFKKSLNYYKIILKREGKDDEFVDSYIRPSYYETVFDKGVDISYFKEKNQFDKE